VKKIFVSLFIFPSIIISLLVTQYQRVVISKQLHDITDKYLRAFYTVYDHEKEISQILFSELTSIKKVDKQLYMIKQTPTKKNQIKNLLYKDLYPHYKELQHMGLKRLELFLPDGNTLLEVEKTKKIQDDYNSEKENLIEYTNKTHKKIDTFEEKNGSYGFAFVYPLFYEKEYVGSIKITFKIAALTSKLMKEYYVLTNFFIHKQAIRKNSFTVKNSYIASPYEDFYLDKEILHQNKDIKREDLKRLTPSKKILQHIYDIGIKNEAKSLYESDINAIFTVIPLFHKLTNQPIAFITIKSKSEDIIASRGYIYTINFLILGILGLSLFILYSLFSKKASLEKEVKEKTRSLNQINTTLEIKIEEKTQKIQKNYQKLSILSQKLKKEKHKYKRILQFASDNIFILNLEGKLINCSTSALRNLGYTRSEIGTLSIFDWNPLITQEDFKKLIKELQYGMLRTESLHKRKDGTTYEVQIYANFITIDKEKYIYASARDVSKEKRLEHQLLQERDFAFSIINNSTMFILTNGMELNFANQSMLDFFNCENVEVFTQIYKCVAYHFVHNAKYFHLGKITNKTEWIQELQKLPEEQRIVSLISQKTYEPKAFRISISKHDNDLYLLNFTDISEQIIKQFDLENRVIHDKLTKTYNREYFDNNIDLILQKNTLQGKQTGIVLIDIDHFKRVNDTYGHDVGDEVLKHLVFIIKKNLQQTDALIRWGGEEFILVLAVEDEKNLYQILEEYRIIIQNNIFKITGSITCSFGGTLHQKQEPLKVTIKRADIALYEAKRNGRNRIVTL
jgi:diguanylate cyclase (GGDEF)-like protein/PAS domain S-box-containing protein